MQTLGLSQALDHIANANSDWWHRQMLRRKKGRVSGRASDFKVDGHKEEMKACGDLKKQMEEVYRDG